MTRICPNFRINPACNTCANNGCNIYTPQDCDNAELNVGLMRWSFIKNMGSFDGSGTVAFHLDITPRYIDNINENGLTFGAARSNTCPASSIFVTPTTGLDITLVGNGDNAYSGVASDFFLEDGSGKKLVVTLIKNPVNNVQGGPGFGAGDRWTQDCWTAQMNSFDPSGNLCYVAVKGYLGRAFIILPDGSESNIGIPPSQFFLRDSWNVPSSGFIGIFTNSEEVNAGPPTGNWNCEPCDVLDRQIVSFSCYDGIPYYWWNSPTYQCTIAGFSGPNSSCKDCGDLNGTFIFSSPNQPFFPFGIMPGQFGTFNLDIPFACACNKGTSSSFANFCSDGTCMATSGCADTISLHYHDVIGSPDIRVILTYTYYAGVVSDFIIGFGTQTCKYGTVKHVWSIAPDQFNYYGSNTLNLLSTTITPPAFDPSSESWVCQSNTSGCVPPGSISLDFLDWTRP